jgi:hypothetical protein
MAAKKARHHRKASRSRSNSAGYARREMQTPPECKVYDKQIDRIHNDLDAAYEQKMKAVNIEARMKLQ